ncbi:hypothetical protein DDB_G0294212 [Dictyostelium discoideum AX4]|uniref:Uncharacterized protein n=1 Tax=Dictyostelium discoideum TaxID=44689 RepID=Q54AU0_DICDI|nr:hypothetical protein DDB_G0294212 [Dictyostelium discoideum AX4]EAL60377.1 hypothetical protein DDB_G0294212 [Dictyostelium discoideum AX4]|eukprot:XP_628790.1 hypothetical protein DDB_G0294212 [Dictyostelium discoideum AX4]
MNKTPTITTTTTTTPQIKKDLHENEQGKKELMDKLNECKSAYAILSSKGHALEGELK